MTLGAQQELLVQQQWDMSNLEADNIVWSNEHLLSIRVGSVRAPFRATPADLMLGRGSVHDLLKGPPMERVLMMF